MSSYRQMRRQARHARRHGMQPMMVINSGNQVPESAALAVTRAAWRYRSELAPAGLAAVLVVAGWWLHAYRPHWWAFLIGVAAAPAWTLAIFGARAGIPAVAERLYAATVTLAAGAWLAAATAACRPPPRCRKHSSSAASYWPCRGGRTGAGAPGSGWSASLRPGLRLPRRSACLARRSCPR